MKHIIFAIFSLFTLTTFADQQFPFPKHRLVCNQYDEPNFGIYWNREIKMQFQGADSADVTLGLGLTNGIPRTVCTISNSELPVKKGTATGYNISGEMNCMADNGDQPTCQGKKMTVNMGFDVDTMKLRYGGYTYDCKWEAVHGQD